MNTTIKSVLVLVALFSAFTVSTAWATSPAEEALIQAQQEVAKEKAEKTTTEQIRRAKRTWGGFVGENAVYGYQMTKSGVCVLGSATLTADGYAAAPFRIVTNKVSALAATGSEKAWEAAESAAANASYDSTVTPAPKAGVAVK